MRRPRLFVNGDVRTFDDRRPRASSVLVVGRHIAAVGGAELAAGVNLPDLEVVDLGGRTVVPGFIDSHFHFDGVARSLYEGPGHGFVHVRLDGLADLEEAKAAIRRAVETCGPGDWILGGRWDKNAWSPSRFPTRWDVDPITPANPLALHSRDGHALWVNTKALELTGALARADEFAPDLALRNEQGQPTGVLLEQAQGLVRSHAPRPTEAYLTRAYRNAIPHLQRLGITGVHDMSGSAARSVFPVVQRLLGEQEDQAGIGMRFLASVGRDGLDGFIAAGIRSGWGSDYLRLGGLKLMVDGALGSQSAWMSRAYKGRGDYCGVPVTHGEDLFGLVRKAAAHGIACACHCIGDRAIDEVLCAFERLPETDGPRLRHRLEHAQHMPAGGFARAARLGVIASMQPIHLPFDVDLTEEHLAPGTGRRTYAFRAMLDARVPLAFGSDAPVADPNPLPGIWAAVARQRTDGTPADGWNPDQRLSVAEAVRAYTVGAAYAAGEERIKGSISAGKLADMVVLSQNIFDQSMPADALRETRGAMTVLDGEIVFRKF